MEKKERVKWYEDREAIENYNLQFKFDVGRTKELLNSINREYKIQSVDDIPNDPESVVLDLYLKGNPEAQKQHSWKKINLNDAGLVIPLNQVVLLSAFRSWVNFDKKHLAKYMVKVDNEFIIDEPEVDRVCLQAAEGNRKYIDQPDQLQRLNMCLTYIEWVDNIIKPHQMLRTKFNNPFTTWHLLFVDRKNLICPYVNYNYVLKGDIN